jgi:hypothetical protein
VSDRDAFEEEMGFLRHASDEDIERVLTGRVLEAGRDGELEELASFVTAIRATVPAQPLHDGQRALVARLAAAALSSTEAAAQDETMSIAIPQAAVWRRRLTLVGRAAVACVLAVAATAGLAFAGVTIPEPARDAFDFAGIELPNQDDESDDPSDGAAGAREDAEPRSSEAKDGGPTADEGSAGTESANRGASHRGKDKSHKGKDKSHKGKDKTKQGSSGGGNGAPASPPADTGPTGVPPGQGGVPPGQGGTPPGQAAPPPGQGGTPPGQGGAIPGSGSGGQSLESHGGGPPGEVPPGQAKPK